MLSVLSVFYKDWHSRNTLKEAANLYISIKTKFIILLSFLMAVILALQFYFTNKTQQDIFNELTQISLTINQAANAYIYQDFPKIEKLQSFLSIEDSLIKQKHINRRYLDNLDIQVERINSIIKKYDVRNKQIVIDKDLLGEVDVKDLKEPYINRFSRNKKSRQIFRNFPSSVKNFVWQDKDSLKWDFEEIKIVLNQSHKGSLDSLIKVTAGIKKNIKRQKPSSFSFMLPDFSKPDSMRFFRYNYKTAQLNQALDNIRNRNMLITLLIFTLSIAAIMLVTRRFLKPIDSLKDSFKRVVDGDLGISVNTLSKDEIGDLTRSFNQMVEELKKNREKEVILQRKERLASLGQLTAGVAHELKNPLNAINLTIDHLNDKFISEDNEQPKKYIETIQNEIRRLDNIVNNFLNYIRSEQLNKSEIDINALLIEVIHLYEREMAAANVDVQSEFTDPFKLKVDGERLKTAFVNIILNAVQAMPEGGKLTVRTNVEKRAVYIIDTGAGIPEKDIEHIFDLFYTTKSSGTGLGMPTAYKIIKEHQGDILINSQEGRGTEVIIQL